MREPRDNSLLFSLKSLEELEASRIEEERAAKERARAAEDRQRARVERLAREAEMRRVEEEERRRLDAERARREEETRLEAEKLASIERVRAEVEARSRAELAQSHAAHDIELAKVHANAARGRYRFFLGLSVLATVAVAAIAGVLSRKLAELNDEGIRRASALELARKDRVDAERALNGARQEIGDLRERLRIRDSMAGAPVAPKNPSTKEPATVAPKKPTKNSGPAPSASCLEGDPLGGCLPPKKK
jgi:membrane protein involved in colicin uptake